MGVLDREYLGMGAEVQQFERALSEFFGRPALCVVNGTSALHLALQACGIGAGDAVLVPSLTYVASFQAISATGAMPIACDVDPDTLLMDVRDAERRMTQDVRAIMPVHYCGAVGDLDSVYAYAKKNKLRVIEDAAHAFGTIYNNKIIGGFGDIACFSFDGIKNITSGEGGCVVTDDATVLRRIQDSRLLGVERDTEQRYAADRSWQFEVTRQGWRYHMSNIMAAIGLEQLRKFPDFATIRKRLARQYDSVFYDHPRIRTMPLDYTTVVPHIYVIRIIGLDDRETLRKKLLERGIQSGFHYQPNHWLSFYKNKDAPVLPVTDKIASELLTLPLHPDLTHTEVDYISSSLLEIIQQH